MRWTSMISQLMIPKLTDEADLHDVKADKVDLQDVTAEEVDLHDVKADEVDLHVTST